MYHDTLVVVDAYACTSFPRIHNENFHSQFFFFGFSHTYKIPSIPELLRCDFESLEITKTAIRAFVVSQEEPFCEKDFLDLLAECVNGHVAITAC